MRFRELYNYPFFYASGGVTTDDLHLLEDVRMQSCLSVFAGIRYNNPRINYFSKIGLGLRAYAGINPHGQFRSQAFYNQWGFVILFE